MVELREPEPPTNEERFLTGAVFGGSALISVLVYLGLTDALTTNQWWYLWPILVLIATLLGAYQGTQLLTPILTKTVGESIARAELILFETVVLGVIAAMAVEGVELCFTGDPFGGVLKLLIVVPFGPWNGLLAGIFTLWLTIPIAIVVGVGVYKTRG